MKVNNEWLFDRFQKPILSIVNNSFGRKFFADLFPRGDYRIIRLLPNSFIIETGNDRRGGGIWTKEYKQTFFDKDEFAIKLHGFIKFVGQGLTCLSAGFGRPEFVFAFLSTDTFNANSGGDGRIGKDHQGPVPGGWTTLRTATSEPAQSAETNGYISGDKTGDPDYTLYRGFFPYNLSTLPGGANVTAADHSLYILSTLDINSQDVAIQESTQASNTALADEDYDNFNSTELANRYTIASVSTNSYKAHSLNSSGKALVVPGQWVKFCVRIGNDIDDELPTGNNYIQVNFSDNASNKPKLDVTYTLGGSFLFNLL